MPNCKKLLFICANYPEPGGVETVTGLLADFFLSKDVSVFLMVLEDRKKPISKQHRHYRQMVEMPGPLNSLLNLSFIENFIRTHRIDCVFNQGVFSQIYKSTSKFPNTLFINTLHSRPFWEVHKFLNSKWGDVLALQKGSFQKFKILVRYLLGFLHPDLTHPHIRRFYRSQIESVDWFVVLDEAFKKELEFKLYQGVGQQKIRVIPNPLKHPEATPVHKLKQVLYIGRLTAEPKRVDRLLRIWSIIEAQVPDWSLQIVGDGEQRINLETLAKSLQLKNVFFRGFQDSTAYYRTASILCLTSTYEGAPMVIPEAQSHGTVPIVFGSVESMYNLIDDGMNGLIVPPFDEKAFANDLLKLIQDEKRLRFLSENALTKVKDLDVESIGQRWLQLLDEPVNR
jgi:glycosyltransferase involved in cell wall biosynthesis